MLVSTMPRWHTATVWVQGRQHQRLSHLPAPHLRGLRDSPTTEPKGLYHLGPDFNVGSCVRVYTSFRSTLKISVFLEELFIFDHRGSWYYLQSVEKAKPPSPHWCSERSLLFLTLFSFISSQRTNAVQLSSEHKTSSVAPLGRMRLYITRKHWQKLPDNLPTRWTRLRKRVFLFPEKQ